MMINFNPKDIDFSKLISQGCVGEDIKVPFDLTAKNFLDFAGDDLKNDSPRETINALSNIKRSIDCLFDSLLFAINFLEDSRREKWSFPEKMTFLGEIGLITPYILSKINSTRNLLEHEFKKPERKEIEIAYDVAILLYYATVRFTQQFINDLSLETPDEKVKLSISVERKTKVMKISFNGQELSFSWEKNPEDYKKWLYVLYQAQYQLPV
jgi:hypothetical protein